MNKILFDIKDIQPIRLLERNVFLAEFYDDEAFDLENNEISYIYHICRYLDNHKKCVLYSPFEDNNHFFTDTDLVDIIADSYEKIDEVLKKEPFAFEVMMAETKECATFTFIFDGKGVGVEKKGLFSEAIIYQVEYSYDEFYAMMKKIYNYLYDIAKILLPKEYFDRMLAAKILQKFE